MVLSLRHNHYMSTPDYLMNGNLAFGSCLSADWINRVVRRWWNAELTYSL